MLSIDESAMVDWKQTETKTTMTAEFLYTKEVVDGSRTVRQSLTTALPYKDIGTCNIFEVFVQMIDAVNNYNGPSL